MTITPIAHIKTDFPTKFGVPRQSGLVSELEGRIIFEPAFRNADALRGIEGFDYLWLIWAFSENESHEQSLIDAGEWAMVRPPRLGGNERAGVFATRSSFRPNNLALSSVRLDSVELDTPDGPILHVRGADLMDGTPIYDIKPYIAFTDSHADARCGFVDTRPKATLDVIFPDSLLSLLPTDKRQQAIAVIAQDPRPSYHSDPTRIYGVPFANYDIRIKVSDAQATIVEVIAIDRSNNI